jgi:aminopeptidase N
LYDLDQPTKRTREEAIRWVALVVAHEIAHQWFGNLVTMKWWNDLWLNEGFASYVEYLAVDNIFPEWKIWEDFSVSEMSPALKADSFFDTHALEAKVNNPGEVSEIFDHISYRKGASLIRMIHEYLGDKNFQKGLRIYLKRHSYGNAETKDLWKAFEEASGVPINKIMGSWTKNVGYPVLSVELNKKNLKLKQERFLLLRGGKSGNNVWNIPVKTSIDGKEIDFVMDLKNKKIALKFEPKNFMKVNYGDSGFYRVFYSKSLFDSLCVAIKEDKIPLLDLVGVARDYFSLSESQHVSVTDFFELVETLKLKNNYILWVEVLKGFSKIGLIFNEEKWIGDYKNYVKKFISPALNYVSWLKRKGEPLENGFLRDMLIASAGFFGDEEVVRKSQELFKNFVEKSKHIDKDIRASVYRVVAYYGGHEEYKKFIDLYKKAVLSEEKSRIANALSSFRQKDILKDVLDFSLSKHVKKQDFREFFGTICRNASGGVLAWNFFKVNWQKILEAFGVGGHKLPILLSYLSFIVDESALREIQAFFKTQKIEGTKRTIAQVIESIEVSLSFKKNHSLAIENWLENKIQ